MISVAAIVWVLTMPVRLIQPYGELLDDADVGEQVEAEAAVALGDRDAEEAEGLHLLDDVGREPSACSSSEATGRTSLVTNRRTVSMISRRTSGSVPAGAGLVATMAANSTPGSC